MHRLAWSQCPPSVHGCRFRYQVKDGRSKPRKVSFVTSFEGCGNSHRLIYVVQLLRVDEDKAHQHKIDGSICEHGIFNGIAEIGKGQTAFEIVLDNHHIIHVKNTDAEIALQDRKKYLMKLAVEGCLETMINFPDIGDLMNAQRDKRYLKSIRYCVECQLICISEEGEEIYNLQLLSDPVVAEQNSKNNGPFSSNTLQVPSETASYSQVSDPFIICSPRITMPTADRMETPDCSSDFGDIPQPVAQLNLSEQMECNSDEEISRDKLTSGRMDSVAHILQHCKLTDGSTELRSLPERSLPDHPFTLGQNVNSSTQLITITQGCTDEEDLGDMEADNVHESLWIPDDDEDFNLWYEEIVREQDNTTNNIMRDTVILSGNGPVDEELDQILSRNEPVNEGFDQEFLLLFNETCTQAELEHGFNTYCKKHCVDL